MSLFPVYCGIRISMHVIENQCIPFNSSKGTLVLQSKPLNSVVIGSLDTKIYPFRSFSPFSISYTANIYEKYRLSIHSRDDLSWVQAKLLRSKTFLAVIDITVIGVILQIFHKYIIHCTLLTKNFAYPRSSYPSTRKNSNFPLIQLHRTFFKVKMLSRRITPILFLFKTS